MKTVGDNNLGHHYQVVKDEMLWSSHVTDKNILFKLYNEPADLFKMMFLDSPIGVVT